MERLAPTREMREMVEAVRGRVEADFGPVNSFQKTAAAAIFMAGRFREFRTRRWGDAIQPFTRVVRYND
jgi:hypothetical protein